MPENTQGYWKFFSDARNIFDVRKIHVKKSLTSPLRSDGVTGRFDAVKSVLWRRRKSTSSPRCVKTTWGSHGCSWRTCGARTHKIKVFFSAIRSIANKNYKNCWWMRNCHTHACVCVCVFRCWHYGAVCAYLFISVSFVTMILAILLMIHCRLPTITVALVRLY